jgi:hypothetical protein
VLDDGPLYTRLQQAVLDHEMRQKNSPATAPMPEALPRVPLVAMRRPAGGFGRRGL